MDAITKLSIPKIYNNPGFPILNRGSGLASLTSGRLQPTVPTQGRYLPSICACTYCNGVLAFEMLKPERSTSRRMYCAAQPYQNSDNPVPVTCSAPSWDETPPGIAFQMRAYRPPSRVAARAKYSTPCMGPNTSGIILRDIKSSK